MKSQRLAVLRRIAQLTDEELSHIQMRLEYNLTASRRLSRKSGSSQNARLVVYKLNSGIKYYYRNDLDDEVINAISKLSPQECLYNKDAVYRIIGKISQYDKVWSGFSYVFDQWPDDKNFPTFRRRAREFVCYLDNREVSTASTVRQDRFSAEVSVKTTSRYRRRNYGKSAVSSWARYHLLAGRIPFYSHIITNISSRELARSLHLRKFCIVTAYD